MCLIDAVKNGSDSDSGTDAGNGRFKAHLTQLPLALASLPIYCRVVHEKGVSFVDVNVKSCAPMLFRATCSLRFPNLAPISLLVKVNPCGHWPSS